MNELENDIATITRSMTNLHEVIACNWTHLPTTHIYARLDELAQTKRLKQFALQLEKQYASNI